MCLRNHSAWQPLPGYHRACALQKWIQVSVGNWEDTGSRGSCWEETTGELRPRGWARVCGARAGGQDNVLISPRAVVSLLQTHMDSLLCATGVGALGILPVPCQWSLVGTANLWHQKQTSK